MTMRHFIDEPFAAGNPSHAAASCWFVSRLVDEDQTALINLALMSLPPSAVTSQVLAAVVEPGKTVFFEALILVV